MEKKVCIMATKKPVDTEKTPAPDTCQVAVIGGGLGGLTSACLLAQAGIDVCLFEMGSKPGGYLAGYNKKDFHFDTAIHWLNQCNKGGLVKRIFDYIESGSPEVREQKAIRRYRSDSYDYLLTNKPDDLKQQLISDFPSEKAGIEKFFSAAQKLGKTFIGLARFLRNTAHMNLFEKIMTGLKTMIAGIRFLRYMRYDAERGLSLFFKDKRIKRIFVSEQRLLSILVPIGWAYVGDFQNPPKGGCQHFPRWLAERFLSFGGKIFYRHKVTQILYEKDRAGGLIWRSGTDSGSLQCRHVIAACDLETVYKKMLPPQAVPDRFKKKFDALKLYDSSVMLNIALSCPARSLGFGEELISLSKDDLPRDQQIRKDPHTTCITLIAPTERDAGLAPDGCGSLIVFSIVDFSYKNNWGLEKDADGNWIRTPEYKKIKEEYADILISRIEETMHIDLRRHILFCDIATPFTFLRYTGNKNGTMMGQRPVLPNFKLRVTGNMTPVKNLWASGHWADYGGGVPIAVKAGANCVLPILKKENKSAYKNLCRALDG
jgi:prolycopene isomerase